MLTLNTINAQPTLYYNASINLDISDQNDMSNVTNYELVSPAKFIHIAEETTEEGINRRLSCYPAEYDKLLWVRKDKPQISQEEFFKFLVSLRHHFLEQIGRPEAQFSYERHTVGDPKSPSWISLDYKLISEGILLILEEREGNQTRFEIMSYQQNGPEDYEFQVVRQFDIALTKEAYLGHFERFWVQFETDSYEPSGSSPV